jgi:hypothetical protein
MLSVYLTLLIIFAVFLLNKLWIYPRKMMKNYVEQVKKLGYSVKLVPYHPLFYDMAVNFFTGMAQGDAMKVYR